MTGEICPKMEFNPPLQLGLVQESNLFSVSNILRNI